MTLFIYFLISRHEITTDELTSQRLNIATTIFFFYFFFLYK